MAKSTSPIEPLQPDDLKRVLAQAKAEQWTELALLGPRPWSAEQRERLIEAGWPASRAFVLANDLVETPDDLATLTSLTSLDLASNEIGDRGAAALAALTSLTSLNLGYNHIGCEGACTLATLTNLTSLDLIGNGIGDKGARALATLTSLTSLDLQYNNIGDEGAAALATLTSLTSLNLQLNSIGADGAAALATLTSLTSLDLQHNNIGAEGAAALLDTWLRSPETRRREQLDLRDNGDLSAVLPTEVLKSTDAQEILAAYRRYCSARAAEALQPLNEAKLLVVGNEAVGKTSLIRYLVHNQPRDPSEAKTPGTVLHEKIETQQWAPSASDVRLNIWDFGGQEIMHNTHRYFLTARSLYLLVLEARREDDRSIYDWMKTIRNRGADSPVIVVINKCEGAHDLRLDEPGLRRDYPNIVAFVRTSCENTPEAAVSIAALRELICETLAHDERLKHVRDPIPTAWQRVKTALADLARAERVLEVREFERLCEAGSDAADDTIVDANEQQALLGLLHDLGIVVAHGLRRGARAAQRQVTLLDPNWLTGAIYALLNHPAVKDNGGEFRRDQLGDLLDIREYPEKWHEFIIDMMEDPEVGLCFELPGCDHQRYLIPEALPPSGPDYSTWPPNSLCFRYDYGLLPSGLIPRFIVQAHRNLTGSPTRWRRGVVLGAAQCQILAYADLDKRQIHLKVAGPATMRRSALNVVLDDLDEVHDLNPEIHPKAMVPLTDQPELAEPYQHLLELEKRYGGDYRFLPRDADREYTASELLDGVRRERRRPREDGDMDDRLEERRPPASRPADTKPVQQSDAKPPASPIRDVVALLAAVCVLVLVLALVWKMTESTVAFGVIGIITILVLVLVLAYVAANTRILRGTQLERVFLAAIDKTSLLGPLLARQKQKPPTKPS